MKFVIERSSFASALKRIGVAVPSNSPTPSLSFVKLASDGSDNLKLEATDMEARIVETIAAAIEVQGAGLLPHGPMEKFTAALPEGAQISVSAEKDRATITSGRARITLPVMPVDTFPVMELSNPVQFECDVSALRNAVTRSVATIATTKTGSGIDALANLHLTFGGEGAAAVTCNRFAASFVHLPKNGLATEHAVLIPREMTRHLLAALPESGEVVVAAAENGVEFSTEQSSLLLRISGEPYPDVRAFFDKANANKHTAIIDIGALTSALNRVAVADQAKTRHVHLELSGTSLKVSVGGADGYEASDEIEVGHKGDDFSAYYQIALLQPLLAAVPGDEATLIMGEPQGPIVFAPEGKSPDRWLIMPYAGK